MLDRELPCAFIHMSQLGDSYMLNSDLSPLNSQPIRRSRKQQQIAADGSMPMPKKSQPVYQQAVHKASRLLATPVALLSLFGEEERIVASVGLEFWGEVPSLQALGIQGCSQLLERSHQCLATSDIQQAETVVGGEHAPTALESYLGLALWTRGGDCVGTLAVMEHQGREFSEVDRETLGLVADWLMGELEREILFQAQMARFFTLPSPPPMVDKALSLEAEAKFNLLSHLCQSLRTPLTAVLGMTGILQRELYGPLNDKQHSYMEVVHHSGQQLVALVDEISGLGGLEQIDSKLTLKAADLEMLCQQSQRDLESQLQHRHQRIELAIDTTHRVWLLDRDKVRQILFYLLLHTLYAVPPESVIGLAVTTSGDRLMVEIAPRPSRTSNLRVLPSADRATPVNVDPTHTQLGLVLSHVLTEAHSGTLERMGLHGHRLWLPLITGDLEETINQDG
jgi:signal transduction histidine kinase